LTQVGPPDDEHLFARNMYRHEINTLKRVRQVGHQPELSLDCLQLKRQKIMMYPITTGRQTGATDSKHSNFKYSKA
jgi:hypothetical protein